MSTEDLRKLEELLDDVERRVKATTDEGIMGQWNTFQYVSNAQDSKLWAEGTPIGKQLLTNLRSQSNDLRDYIDSTMKFVNELRELVEKQRQINSENV